MTKESLVPIKLPADPTNPLEAATKQYVDAKGIPAHASTHQPGGSDPMAVDAVVATGSLRTLGTGAQQAAQGSHTHAGLAPALNIKDEGTLITATPSGMNFVGDGVTVAGTPEPTITIPGAPTGAVMMWVTATPPSGWLLCNGSAIPGGNTALIALIGANTPDMRDFAPVGASATKTLNTTGGSATKSLVTANVPSHIHTMGHTHTVVRSSLDGTTSTTVKRAAASDVADSTTSTSSAQNTGTGSGTGSAFDVMNPYLAVNFIIKT